MILSDFWVWFVIGAVVLLVILCLIGWIVEWFERYFSDLVDEKLKNRKEWYLNSRKR